MFCSFCSFVGNVVDTVPSPPPSLSTKSSDCHVPNMKQRNIAACPSPNARRLISTGWWLSLTHTEVIALILPAYPVLAQEITSQANPLPSISSMRAATTAALLLTASAWAYQASHML